MKRFIVFSLFASIVVFVFAFSVLAKSIDNSAEGIKRSIKIAEKEAKATGEAFKKVLEEKRVEAKKIVEKEKTELKEKLTTIKDAKKKQAVEKIDNQLKKLNDRMLDHYSNVLEKYEGALNKISDRAEKIAESGTDTSPVDSAIENAKVKIGLARDAIKAQAGKVYKIMITTDLALKQDVGKARQELHNDLVKVRDAVFAARDAAKEARQALRKLLISLKPEPKETENSTATTSTSTSTSTNNQ